jgi:hypothetical protein
MKKPLSYLIVALMAIIVYAIWMRHHFSTEQIKWKAEVRGILISNDSLHLWIKKQDSFLAAAAVAVDTAEFMRRTVEQRLINLRYSGKILKDSLGHLTQALDSIPILVSLIELEGERADTAESLANQRKTSISELRLSLDTARVAIRSLDSMNARLKRLVISAPLEPLRPKKWLGILNPPSTIMGAGLYINANKQVGGGLFFGLGWSL